MSGRLIAVVGPSGVGKDTVMTALAKAAPRLHIARRVITRPNDAGGEDFDAVSADEFAAIRDAGGFAISWSAHGLSYGIPVQIKEHLKRGEDVLANLSRGVLSDVNLQFPGFLVLALSADTQVLASRLAARGREDQDDIARRLQRADYPLPEGMPTSRIDNSGALTDTVKQALHQLYPVRV